MLKIRDRLQAIEDELAAAGFDEFIVATDAGAFTWNTVERAGPRRAWRRSATGRLCVKGSPHCCCFMLVSRSPHDGLTGNGSNTPRMRP